jgi:cobaltochelatase CobS
MSDVFGLPPNKCMNPRGQAIQVQVIDRKSLNADSLIYIPDIDPNYVFDINLVKVALMALQMNRTGYFWGYHGSGKTTCWEQVCARTGRPFIRNQHTLNTEESHILGQWTVREGSTHFSYGPLPLAMINGWVYCADEYDAALPSVSLVYQPVLEGKPLIIKEAPPELRVVRPHKNFRIVGTGNTNGVGDETGLYQGTQIQNAANYSRWRLTEEVKYPPADVETAIVMGQTGAPKADAKKLVDFANEWRKAFAGGQVSSTISPRELIGAAEIALWRGSDWRGGLCLAFANRLSRTDKEVANQYAQRIFGGE